jgi:hypothetical protein
MHALFCCVRSFVVYCRKGPSVSCGHLCQAQRQRLIEPSYRTYRYLDRPLCCRGRANAMGGCASFTVRISVRLSTRSRSFMVRISVRVSQKWIVYGPSVSPYIFTSESFSVRLSFRELKDTSSKNEPHRTKRIFWMSEWMNRKPTTEVAIFIVNIVVDRSLPERHNSRTSTKSAPVGDCGCS